MLMNSLRLPMHAPTLPSRSKLAQSVAMTQSNFWPRLRFLNKLVGIEKCQFLRASASSFQQVTFLPSVSQARASGRVASRCNRRPAGCGRRRKRCGCSRMPSRMRSMIFGCGLQSGGCPGRVSSSSMILQHLVAVHDGIVHDKAQLWACISERRPVPTRPWMRLRCWLSRRKPAFLLVGVAEDADENRRRCAGRR